MKNLYLILVTLFSLTGNTYCQLNIIDNDREKLWYIISGAFCYPIDTCYMETEVLKLGEKVIKNELTYTSVLKTSDSTLTTWDKIGYLREIDRKVYYRPVSKDSDYLLYDFNLGLSSEIYIINPLYGEESIRLTVNRIDSVYFGTEKRKRMFFSEDKKEIWIEGIGSLKGLIYSGILIDGGFKEISCFLENGNVIYKNPKYEGCFCIRDIDKISEIDNDLFLYPNPVNGIVCLRGMINVIFQLFDLSGLQIMKCEIKNNNFNIDVSMLQSGVFLYNIKYHNTNMGGKLIIKDK